MDEPIKAEIEEPVVRLPAGSVVLTKIRGFQPWPSMVLEDKMAPSYLNRKKPKNIKVSVPNGHGKKGSTVKSSNEIYLVRFFHDDTYQWVSRLEITEMGPDANIIEDFKQKQISSVKKMPKSLEQAYNVAKKGLTLEKFSQFGSYGADEEEDIEVVEVKTKKRSQPVKKTDTSTKTSAKKTTITTTAANNKKRKAGTGSTEAATKKRNGDGVSKAAPNGSVDIAVLSSSGSANFEKREEEIKELEAEYKKFIDDSAWKSIPLKDDSKKYIENVKSQLEIGEEISNILVRFVVESKEDEDAASVDEVKEQLEKLEEMRMYISVCNKLGLNLIMAELLGTTKDEELKKQLQKTCLSIFGEDLVV